MTPGAAKGVGADLVTARIETLGDGVFAIVMTILVFDLRVPVLAPEVAHDALPGMIVALWPNFFSYFLTFVILGIFWIAHDLQFHYISRSNRMHFWTNIVFYMAIALIPFSAALLARYPLEESAVLVYGLNLLAAAGAIVFHWVYATRIAHLNADPIPEALQREAARYMIVAPILYVAAIAVSFVAPVVSLLLYAATPVYYIFPARIDRYLPGGPLDPARGAAAAGRLPP